MIGQNQKPDNIKQAHKALNDLMLKSFKTVTESHGKRRRAAAQEELVAEVEQYKEDGGADAEGTVTRKSAMFENG